MKELLWVLMGGALGTGVRYGLGKLASQHEVEGFYSTALVNMVGAFLIGYCAVALKNQAADPLLQAALLVGLFGGLTTFSSLTLEAVTFLQQGAIARAAVYVVAQVLVGLLLTFLGVVLATRGQ